MKKFWLYLAMHVWLQMVRKKTLMDILIFFIFFFPSQNRWLGKSWKIREGGGDWTFKEYNVNIGNPFLCQIQMGFIHIWNSKTYFFLSFTKLKACFVNIWCKSKGKGDILYHEKKTAGGGGVGFLPPHFKLPPPHWMWTQVHCIIHLCKIITWSENSEICYLQQTRRCR